MRYNGPAVIIANDGTELAAQVSLSVKTSGHLKRWEGHGTMSIEDGLRLQAELGNQRLRLPDGREGLMLVSNTSFSSSSSTIGVTILGSGPPPF